MASSSPKKTSPAGGEDQAWKQKLNIPAKVRMSEILSDFTEKFLG